MANAYSIQRNRQGWIDPTDQDFTLKALMFKQQKYDANQAKVDSVIENYKSLQLARGVDKDYLNERVKYLIDNINQFGPQDYGSNAATQSIKYHIDQALDENVMTAIQETSKIKAYQAEVEKIKEKDPKAYNQLNDAYGMAPAQEYMQNQEVGAKINGSLRYTPFKDIEGEVNTWLTDIQKNAKDGVVQLPDPNNPGQIIETTINGKSANELRQLALGYIGDRYNDQLKVNVWGNTGGFKQMEPQVQSAIQSYDSVIGTKNKELIEIQTKLTGNLSNADKENLKQQAKSLENDINEHNQMKGLLESNPVGALVYLEKNKLANRSGLSLGLLQTKSVEYKKDDYYFAQLDNIRDNKRLELEYAKNESDMAYKAEDLRIKQEELRLKALGVGTKSEKDSKSDGTDSSTGEGMEGAILEEVGLGDGQEAMPNYRQMWEGEIQSKRTAVNQFSAQTMQAVMDIATGKVQAGPEEVKSAKAAITEFRSKGGNLNPGSEKQIIGFMRTISRSDAYKDLSIIPVGGKNVNIKQQFKDMYGDFSDGYFKYNKARAQAQAAEAKGTKGAYGDNQEFINQAKSAVPYSVSKQLNIPVDSKNAGMYNQLISMSEEAKAGGEFSPVEEKSSVKIKDLRNGKYQVSYSTKVKNEDKEDVLRTKVVTIDGVNARKMLPQLGAFDQKQGRFTIESMGTKPRYSTGIVYDDVNSKEYLYKAETLSSIRTSPLDEFFIDRTNAKSKILETTGVSSLRNPEEKVLMNNLVSTLLSEDMMNKYRTSVYFGYSATSANGIGYTSLNTKTGEKVATINWGSGNNLDNQIKMNDNAPQVIYSQLIMNEVKTMMDNYKKSGILEATPAIKKMING